ncbi:MAG: metallophosphoesterase [Tannerellaceae bacterium]|nr:metallophosphoesterase [Tannerellaceae bacterium]
MKQNKPEKRNKYMWILLGGILFTVLAVCADLILYQFFIQLSKTAGIIYAIFGLSSLIFCLVFLTIYGLHLIYFHDLRWAVFAFLLLNIPKIFFLLFWLLAIFPFQTSFGENKIKMYLCLILDLVVIGMIIHGGLIGRTRLIIKKVEVPSERLPAGFDGFRIVHFSDFHLGSFGKRTQFVQRVVNRINGLTPDIVFFTGDIVNDRSMELEPFLPILGQIQAPYGVYSVLGNHDYGDYYDWEYPEDKIQNLKRLQKIQENWGWVILNNESLYLEKEGDRIALLGVENWGDPPFQQYGNLREAYEEVDKELFSILLSHNPIHWTEEVIPDTNIDLTLSGHTHAFQLRFGNLSPAALRYPEWGGLYQEGA